MAKMYRTAYQNHSFKPYPQSSEYFRGSTKTAGNPVPNGTKISDKKRIRAEQLRQEEIDRRNGIEILSVEDREIMDIVLKYKELMRKGE
jgi:hypothetical protein